MGQRLDKLTIQGFKSIESLDDFALGNLNVLIGANGSGKSNFVDFFRMLRAMSEEGLQQFIQRQGGGDGFFFLGPKQTPKIEARMEFGPNAYEFSLAPGANGGLFVSDERTQYTEGGGLNSMGKGNLESRLKSMKDERSLIYPESPGVGYHVFNAVCSWVVYHFHDTSLLAPMRRDQPVRDFDRLRPDAANIAAYLLRLRENSPTQYAMIRDTVRLIAPFFDDFALRPESRGGDEVVRLEWTQKGSDFPFQPSQLSDGTIRFICLATALQQVKRPATIIIDEPELGLHPYAISLVGDLISAAAEKTQVIVATQSPLLLDHFPPEAVIVVDRQDGRSLFRRLDPEEFREWMQEYSLGELWQKNVVQGSPHND